MTFQVDLFLSFRSPYSYLAVPRLMLAVATARAGLDRSELDEPGLYNAARIRLLGDMAP